MAHKLEWFKNRIGKRIFRDSDTCVCETCKDVAENGMIILDENHASYLHMVEHDFGIEGHVLNYRDIK